LRAPSLTGVGQNAFAGFGSAAQSRYRQKAINFATNPERRVKNSPGKEASALMFGHMKRRFPFVVVALVASAIPTVGRAQLQLPRIDPTGESLFVWPNAPVVAAPAPLPVVGPAPIAAAPIVATPAPPMYQSLPPMVPSSPFGNVTAPPVYSDPPGMIPTNPLVGPAPGIASTVPTLPPPPVVAPTGAVVPNSQLPPPPGVALQPVLPTANVVPYGKEYLRVSPEGLVAPVGSEMLLKAGIIATDGHLVMNQRVDWSINPCGAGMFTELGFRDRGQLLGFLEAPQRIDNWNATSTTAVVPITLNTSTPDPNDDVPIYRGEAWVTVMSPVEGTSVVTAEATAYSEFNRGTSTIYWVDAQWFFPQPSVVEPGRSHTLTTTVVRKTDGAPLAGWIVRYDVSGGALGYEGGNFIESPTDGNGRASVEVTPKDAGGGVTTVGITVIRPPTAGPAVMPRLQLGRSVTTVSWAPGVTAVPVVPVAPTAPPAPTPIAPPPPTLPQNMSPPAQTPNPYTPAPNPYTPAPSSNAAAVGKPRLDASMRLTGTDQISVGNGASFELTVTNRGDGIARHVVITDRFDRGLRHPMAKPNEYTVVYPDPQRTQMDLAPNESKTIPLTFIVVDGGMQCHVATVTADGADPVSQKGCVTARQAALEVKITGPRSRVVGEAAEFSATIRNVGDVAASNIELVIHCDAAITPTAAESGAQPLADNGLLLKIDSLAPAEKRTFKMQGQCRTASNRACARATITAEGGVNQADEACVEILPPLTSGAPAAGGSPTASNLTLTVRMTSTPARVGEKQLINVIIENPGQQTETKVSMRLYVPQELTADTTQIQPPAENVLPNENRSEIRFPTVAELPPGQQLRYVIPVTPNRTGRVQVQAQFVSSSVTTPKTVDSDVIDIVGASP
jgi:hypothetical protein